MSVFALFSSFAVSIANKLLKYFVKNYYFYIVSTIAALLFSAALYATDTNAERLIKLQPLIDYDLDFNTGVTLDSIITWEKILGPELEKQKQFDFLFQLKMMAVQALITQGNNSLAINSANSMYQKAKEIDYPLGIALSLRAIGNTYLSSTTPQAGIDSYEEAIKMISKIPHSESYAISALAKLIFIKLQTGQLKDIPEKLELLKALYQKNPQKVSNFPLLSCNAFYYIKINNLPKAFEYLQRTKAFCNTHPYPYNIALTNYLFSCYHIESKEYALALKEYNELLQRTKNSGSYRHVQMLQERAKILELMGQSLEACRSYDSINILRDSLDAKSYSRQITELHTLYQIDQSELDNVKWQKLVLYWSISLILIILILIVFFIFRIKRENKYLLRSQKEQEKAKKQAENSIRTKSLFLSNMSHEIRTPLNALSGFSTILTEESIDTETRKQCNDIIQQNSELLLQLINDVIDLSSLEIGKMAFKFKDYDAVAICRNVIDMVEKIKQTNADVYFDTPLNSLILSTDNARLQQVLINLLINATKFTPQGSITLKLDIQNDTIACFSVTDTGYGIPKEKQDQIFNRFEKLNENAQGTGLGLSICQLIIEQLGGKIWIDPDYTGGARFIFTHPIPANHEKKEGAK